MLVSELEFLLLFYLYPKCSDRKLRLLIEKFGSADAFKTWLLDSKTKPASFKDFVDLVRHGPLDQVRQLLANSKAKCRRIIHYYQADYPYRLKQIPDAPMILFVDGQGELSPHRSVGVVGTRQITPYGQAMVKELIAGLSHLNVHIYSGLAYGVDGQAHRQALQSGLPTSAVLGHSLEQPVLLHNRSLAKQMQQHGCLISEFAPGEATLPFNFAKRNRILAGLVDVLIVVESASKGGSLITANLANQYNREVMAVPGNLDREFSTGCNALIKEQKAHLYSSVEDLSTLMGWESRPETKTMDLFNNLSDKERELLELMSWDTVHFSWLADSLDWPMHELSMTLLELEMKNFISSLPAKRYRRK